MPQQPTIMSPEAITFLMDEGWRLVKFPEGRLQWLLLDEQGAIFAREGDEKWAADVEIAQM